MTAVLPSQGVPARGKETSVRPGSRRTRSSEGQYGLVSSSRAWRVLVSAALVVTGVLMLLPVAWVVLTSLEPPSEQFLLPPVWFPTHLTLASYRSLFAAAPFLL